ncbi:MAG: amidohydrolase [Gemmatimonadetes bacterium]|nr:MAG: amidohydrolase [Gemmatimonadota bacterium]
MRRARSRHRRLGSDDACKQSRRRSLARRHTRRHHSSSPILHAGSPVPTLRLHLAALCAAFVANTASAQQSRADLVLLHGDLFTVDSQHPRAQAVAVRGDRIAAVGSDAEIQGWVGPRTRVIDLRGRLAIPGFIDGHGHYTALGESKLVLDLTKARTWDDIVVQVRDAAAAAKPGTLIEGRGWHQEKWTHAPAPNVEGVPLHASLDAVSARNPVVLEHASGHASFVNGAALRLAGVGRETPNPAGGEIVKDSSGEPTGLLKESAQSLIGRARAKLPHLTKQEEEARFRKIVQLAGDDALSKGVTSFHDAGSSFATIDGFKQLAREGKLPVRLYVMVRFESDSTLDAKLDGYLHAIGDRANREVLDTYQRIFRDNADAHDLRWRIEHAQHIDPLDVPRFKALGVIASMQGVHTISDGPWVAKRLGEERARRTSYPWRSLLDAGAVVTNGTDTPVEDVDPIMSFYGSVTRKTREGVVFVPEQRVTRDEGLRAYTLNNAYAAFEEKEKGSLTPGKLADIVVLSKNIMTAPEDDIPSARVDLTILGGKVRYERRTTTTAAREAAPRAP